MSLLNKVLTIAAIASLLIFNAACSKSEEHVHADHEGHDHEGHEDHADHDGENHDDHEDGDHDKKEAGPNGGRIVTSVEPHLEFFVREDGKVQISFLSEENKVIAPSGQIVSAITGERMSPTQLKFAMDGNVLVSDKKLPEGNNHPTILNIIAANGQKPVMEKFNLNLSECPECNYQEYACVCDHDH